MWRTRRTGSRCVPSADSSALSTPRVPGRWWQSASSPPTVRRWCRAAGPSAAPGGRRPRELLLDTDTGPPSPRGPAAGRVHGPTTWRAGGTPPCLTRSMLIRAKRDGGRLSDAEIRWLIGGYTDGRHRRRADVGAADGDLLPRPRPPASCTAWTDGHDQLRRAARPRRAVPAPTVDKHSTGGVGDKISLILAPLVAAAARRCRRCPAAASAIPAARWTSWSRSPAGGPRSRTPRSRRSCATIGCVDLRRRRAWRRPTASSTRCATSPARSSRMPLIAARSCPRRWRRASTRWCSTSRSAAARSCQTSSGPARARADHGRARRGAWCRDERPAHRDGRAAGARRRQRGRGGSRWRCSPAAARPTWWR